MTCYGKIRTNTLTQPSNVLHHMRSATCGFPHKSINKHRHINHMCYATCALTHIHVQLRPIKPSILVCGQSHVWGSTKQPHPRAVGPSPQGQPPRKSVTRKEKKNITCLHLPGTIVTSAHWYSFDPEIETRDTIQTNLSRWMRKQHRSTYVAEYSSHILGKAKVQAAFVYRQCHHSKHQRPGHFSGQKGFQQLRYHL